MLKDHTFNRVVVGMVALSLVFSFWHLPRANAVGLSSAKDTISNSHIGAPATQVVDFTTVTDVGINGYFEVTLPLAFGDIKEAGCIGPNVTVATTTETVRCTYSVAPGATSTRITITNVNNPGTPGLHLVDVTTYNSGDTELDTGEAGVFIIGNIGASGHIDSSLSFTLGGDDGISVVNGILITGSSTLTTLPFGTIEPGTSSTLAQTFAIATNATNGYSLTVQQTTELINPSSDTINSFDNSPDGTGSTTPHTWKAPSNLMNKYNTYGHLGVTTDDFTLSALDYSGSKYTGINGTIPSEVMYHSGISDGKTLGIGLAHVAYTLEIGSLQEAGDYTSTLTYVCTPNY